MKIKNKFLNMVFLSFFLIIVSDYPLYALSGTVVDNETGEPIEGAAVVRSWKRETATPAGMIRGEGFFSETLSDEEGKFFISNFQRLIHIGIPVFFPITENALFVYKPGYYIKWADDEPPIIKLTKIPATYYLRYEENEKVSGNYSFSVYKTKILKRMVKEEEEHIKSLNKFVPGVWYTGFNSPNDIAIDSDDTVFVADRWKRAIYKLSQKDKIIKKKTPGKTGWIDIEIDRNGTFYEFAYDRLYGHGRVSIPRLRIHGDRRFTIIPNKGLFVINKYEPFFVKYSFDGKVLCKLDFSNRDTVTWTSKTRLFQDIDSTPDDRIAVAYYCPNRGMTQSKRGVIIFDSDCKMVFDKEIAIDNLDIRSIDVTKSGLVIIAGKRNIYIYDQEINLIHKEQLTGRDLGNIDIQRISSDMTGTFLYIAEGRYERVLKYNIKAREFCIK